MYKEFVRITTVDGRIYQGGSNYGIRIENADGMFHAQSKKLGSYLRDGDRSLPFLLLPEKKVATVEIGKFVDGELRSGHTYTRVPQDEATAAIGWIINDLPEVP